MFKKFSIFILSFFLFLLSTKATLAVYDPTSVPNNRFGIHIADTVDIPDAANLVNSSGGDWGYVTFVITKGDRNIGRWQNIFDEERRLHLIPIVRIATRIIGDKWEKPDFGEIDGWVNFLSSLNWVVKNRYVIIGNEPNHAGEWGGEVNPEEYASYLKIFSERLKGVSSDFFVLPAGFDASAPKSKTSMDETLFLQRMLKKEPDAFKNIDGWASHSYPNPAFSGPDNGIGRGTVRTFEWELSLLKGLGIEKNFPVFITETGWAHPPSDNLGQKFTNAFNNAWNDKRVVAVTPFILKYNEPPFDVFSWKDKDGKFFDFYYDVQKIAKVKGEPIQETKGEILSLFVVPFNTTNADFTGFALVRNTGQSIWEKGDIALSFVPGSEFELTSFDIPKIEPQKEAVIVFRGKTSEKTGASQGSIVLISKGKLISNTKDFEMFITSPLRMQIRLIFAKIVSFLGL